MFTNFIVLQREYKCAIEFYRQTGFGGHICHFKEHILFFSLSYFTINSCVNKLSVEDFNPYIVIVRAFQV